MRSKKKIILAAAAFVDTVTASIASVSQAVGAVGTCDATDYTLATPGGGISPGP